MLRFAPSVPSLLSFFAYSSMLHTTCQWNRPPNCRCSRPRPHRAGETTFEFTALNPDFAEARFVPQGVPADKKLRRLAPPGFPFFATYYSKLENFVTMQRRSSCLLRDTKAPYRSFDCPNGSEEPSRTAVATFPLDCSET